MNWYIGQRIVAVVDNLDFKKGDVFTIKDITDCCGCKCKSIGFDIGLGIYDGDLYCHTCYTTIKNCQVLWKDHSFFAPLDESPELSEFTNETIIESIEPVYI